MVTLIDYVSTMEKSSTYKVLPLLSVQLSKLFEQMSP